MAPGYKTKQQVIDALDECVKKLDRVIQNRTYTLMKRAQARKKAKMEDVLC